MPNSADNSFLKWSGLGVTVAGFAVGAVLYVEDAKSRVIEVHHTLSEVELMLEEIQKTQAQHFTQRENRFEELEVGQRNIKDTLTTSQDDLFFHIGVLTGRLDERDHPVRERTEPSE